MPYSKFWYPGCASAAKKFWRRHCWMATYPAGSAFSSRSQSSCIKCFTVSRTAWRLNNIYFKRQAAQPYAWYYTTYNSLPRGAAMTRHRLSRTVTCYLFFLAYLWSRRTTTTTRFSSEGMAARNRRRQGIANMQSVRPARIIWTNCFFDCRLMAVGHSLLLAVNLE